MPDAFALRPPSDVLDQLFAHIDPALSAEIARILEDEEAHMEKVRSYCRSYGYVLTPRGEDEMRRIFLSARAGFSKFRLLPPDYTTPMQSRLPAVPHVRIHPFEE